MDISKYENSIKFTPEQFEKLVSIANATNQNVLKVAKDVERMCENGKVFQEAFDELMRGAE